ncbi:hypothetical protein ACLMAJ_26285 [Nocardia sp. KC 131]|uniref:hypothetical protein n=1 Tax=Nocardia arseniciresistens TaxID=3392119 RepID=UPI00398EB71A
MATRSVPQPPFSAELLADLHADNLAPDLGEQLWPVVRADPEALGYLHSLDEVSEGLRTLGRDDHIIHAMPADVAARLEQFVGGLDEEEEPEVRPHGIAAPISLDDRRPRRLRWLAAAAAAVVIVASAAGALSMFGGNEDAPTAQPTTGNVELELGDNLNTTAALSVLGRNDVTGPLGSQAALNRCVRANGLDRTVLGSTNTTFHGNASVLILVTGPRPHKITAIVVGIGCTTDDPQQLALTDIG